MSSNKKILILPGDGIGREVMSEVLNIIHWMTKNKSVSFDISERLVGGIAYDKEGDSISDTTMQEALNSDLELFAHFFRRMLKHGVYLAPSAFESLFVSTAHTEEDLERTAKAFRKALEEN